MKSLNVFVAAGSGTPFDDRFIEEGKKLGKYLGKNGYTLVHGASKKGLMGAVYNSFIEQSKNAILHLWDIFEDEGEYIGKIIKHKSLNERLEGFLKDSDVVIILPGANGTLHEFSTFFEYSKQFKTHYRIILVNYEKFYEGLLMQFVKQYKTGFYREYDFFKRVQVVENVDEAINLLPKIKK